MVARAADFHVNIPIVKMCMKMKNLAMVIAFFVTVICLSPSCAEINKLHLLQAVSGPEDGLLFQSMMLDSKEIDGNLETYVTENNAAGFDAVGPDGKAHDEYRIYYLREHFKAARRAMRDGVDLRGYMVWTLMDNLEWAAGFRVRCGLVHTDFKTLRRTWKDSAFWYRDVIRANGVE